MKFNRFDTKRDRSKGESKSITGMQLKVMDTIRNKFMIAKKESKKRLQQIQMINEKQIEEERQNVMKFWARKQMNKAQIE